ncbi:MAG: hypothetical protein ACRESA_07180 [Gammaproteobacteria bacterium]
MPLTRKGRTILRQMQKEYGQEKGKAVFYAARNNGRITGVDRARRPLHAQHRISGNARR